MRHHPIIAKLAMAMAIAAAGAPNASAQDAHDVPLFLSASETGRQGFVRVINREEREGTVSIVAVDDAGARSDPVVLTLASRQTRHFNSTDLENGAPEKGLTGSVGAGDGDWRLELDTALDIDVLTYIRTLGNDADFLTTMHDLVGLAGRDHEVPIFNPGSNANQVSKLRVINRGTVPAEVTVVSTDDAGAAAPEGEAAWTIHPGGARTTTAQELEGMVGDGVGKWRLAVSADQSVQVMSLLDSVPTGRLANLSTKPPPATNADGDLQYLLPLFPPASDPVVQGFARVTSRDDDAGTVTIEAIDDLGMAAPAVTLSLEPGETKHFNSDDLEAGNEDKGLSGGVGVGAGNWRLLLSGDIEFDAMGYIRTDDGFVTSMHDTLPLLYDERYEAPTFNPGSNMARASQLRLINPGAADATIAVSGVDDAGDPSPGGHVALTLPANQAISLSAADLEAGSAAFDGRLGDGAGKWRMNVASDVPIQVASLLMSDSGHITNLSSAAAMPGQRTHNVILRVVVMTPDWHEYVYSGGGWPAAVKVKESTNLKYFEAAVWLEIDAIHLYEFDHDFDQHNANRRTPEQWTAHRESYRIRRVADLQLQRWTANLLVREAFVDFVDYIVSQYPNSDHHLVFSGHGGPGGRLFEGHLSYTDAGHLLARWAALLGRPLGVIDMGGPCNKGGYEDLANFCPHARFYVASDLPNGGFEMDEWTAERFDETDPDTQYHRLFAESPDLHTALVGRIDLKRQRYEYSRENMTESETMQANYLYSCREFTPFANRFQAFLNEENVSWSLGDDMLEFLRTNDAAPGLQTAFRRVISHRADNRHFFEWQQAKNGITMPDPRNR